MRSWRRGDLTSVMAILSGTVLGAWVIPGAYRSVGPPEHIYQMVPVEVERPMAFSGEGVAFHASNLGSGWSVEGDYGGFLTRQGSTLRVELSAARTGAAWIGEDNPHIAGIRLALAEDTSEGWRVVESGALHSLDQTLQQGEDLQLGGHHLTLPNVPDSELVGRWLVIVHELRVPGAEGWSTAWTYAHADRELIPRLMGWVEDGC